MQMYFSEAIVEDIVELGQGEDEVEQLVVLLELRGEGKVEFLGE